MSASTEPTVPEVTPEEYDRRRKLLTDALRSREYPQTRYRLRHTVEQQPPANAPIGYCCLGVACDLFQKATGRGEWEERLCFPGVWDFVVGPASVSTVMPDVIVGWFGFSDMAGTFGSDPERQTLASLNDHGKSFAEIADVIDSKPEGLFTK